MSLVVPIEELFSNESGLLAKAPHWQRVELHKIITLINGYALKSALFNRGKGFPIIRIRDLKSNRTETLTTETFPKEYIVNNGDFLVGMDGDFICYKWSGGQAVLNQRVCKLIANEEYLNPQFLYYVINGYLDAIQQVTSSVTVKHLSSIDVLRIPFPIPPLAEQNRIVAKLDELMARVVRSRARLEQIPKILNRFRKSVFSKAVSGKLTEEWRAKNGYHNDWPIESLGNVVSTIKAGKSIKCIEAPPDKGEVGIVKVSAVSWGEFLEDESKTITDKKFFNKDFVINRGEFLFSRDNTKELVGAVVIVREITRALMLSDKILRFTLSDKVIPEWILYNLKSEKGRRQIEDLATGNQQSMMNIGQGKIREIEFFLPDKKEQTEIVRRVEELFLLANKIEVRYNAAKAQLENLPQSLLAKAFRGELVSQDSADVPVSVLVKKICEGQRKMTSRKDAKSKTIA
jgi:type I restriction enzyme S subunit